ncbi:hypothetical protein FPOAC1_007318 [Fusarium poae]|uniref:hypothetical protein n=1 Tax=Fusarium poae TaxID=36050 RepID=UPI001CEAE222|nr:hypothetical protein FPOAC1_007318 [Fusarium poae]KAG8673999.1 hypothetical protein FPOAC1_007318 [Fusarium poae]
MSDYPREDASWLNHWCSTVLQVPYTPALATNEIEGLVTQSGMVPGHLVSKCPYWLMSSCTDHRGTQLELSFRAGPSRSILASPLNGLLSSFELAGARRVAT